MPYRAAKLIFKTPTLLLLSVIPTSLTIFLYRFFLHAIVNEWDQFQLFLFSQFGFKTDTAMFKAITYLGHGFGWAISLVSFGVIVTLIASPFNDWLAEAAESRVFPPLAASPKTSFKQKIKLLVIDLSKSVAATVGILIALSLSWVPLVNLLVGVVGSLLVTFQYISYPQTRRQIGVKEGLKFLVTHFAECVSFGFSVTLLLGVPILGFVAIPLAVVGGTWLYSVCSQK